MTGWSNHEVKREVERQQDNVCEHDRHGDPCAEHVAQPADTPERVAEIVRAYDKQFMERVDANYAILTRTRLGDCKKTEVHGFMAAFHAGTSKQRLREILKAVECDCGRCVR